MRKSITLQGKRKLNAGRSWAEEDNQHMISLYLENAPRDKISDVLQRRSCQIALAQHQAKELQTLVRTYPEEKRVSICADMLFQMKICTSSKFEL